MLDRRESARNKVIHGGVEEIGQRGMTRDSIGGNRSEDGAASNSTTSSNSRSRRPRSASRQTDRSWRAKIVQWRDRFVGVAFGSEKPYELPFSDLEQRLRQSERKKRQLQRRIDALLSRD